MIRGEMVSALPVHLPTPLLPSSLDSDLSTGRASRGDGVRAITRSMDLVKM